MCMKIGVFLIHFGYVYLLHNVTQRLIKMTKNCQFYLHMKIYVFTIII